MVQFVFAVRSVGMLHQRSGNAVRRCRNGNRSGRRLLCRRVSLALSVIVWASAWGIPTPGFAVDPTPTKLTPAQPLDFSDAQALQSVQWLASLALDKMPRTIDGDKEWGDTKRIWAGVKVRFDDGKLKTHRRFRKLEHGRWVRYKIRLPDVDARNRATAKIHQVEFRQQTEVGMPRWHVKSTVVAPMKFEARIQRWNLGVKLFSMTIEGRMRLRMKSSALIGLETEFSEIPPALVFDPHIQKAKIDVESFEVDRVSHIGGDVAEGWGEVVQEVIVETYVKRLNKRLVAKLNRAIDKERDDLRISIAQWFCWKPQ
jgi:head-tail adaptor